MVKVAKRWASITNDLTHVADLPRKMSTGDELKYVHISYMSRVITLHTSNFTCHLCYDLLDTEMNTESPLIYTQINANSM